MLGYTSSGLHQATDVVIDLMLDEADTGAQADGLGQIGLEIGRLLVDPGVEGAAALVESGRSDAYGDDP